MSPVAAKIFARYGLDFPSAAAAEAWTNAVWLTDAFAIRVATEKNTNRIRREAELARFLPREINYPKLVGIGVEDGYEWSVAERIEGVPVREVWGGLDYRAKLAVIAETLDMMKAVHEKVPCKEAASHSQTYAWFSRFDKTESASMNVFTEAERTVLSEILRKFYARLEKETPVLCHGDITEDNILYRGGKVVSLIDFENSVIAPPMLDIHGVYNLAFLLDGTPGPPDYRQAAMGMLSPWLAKEGADDLLLGYAVLFRQRILECWLKYPERKPEDSDAYQKLRRIICSRTI